jgi:hypothetical protein
MLGPEHGKGLSPEVLASLQSALESGVTTILWLIAALGVAAFLTSLAFPIVAVQTTKVDVALE